MFNDWSNYSMWFFCSMFFNPYLDIYFSIFSLHSLFGSLSLISKDKI